KLAETPVASSSLGQDQPADVQTSERRPTPAFIRMIRAIPLAVRFGAIFLAAILGSIGAYWQLSSDFAWHEGWGARWWFRPIDWHVDAGLPNIAGNIRAVEVIRDRVFVAGDTGLLAFSLDNGRRWTLLNYSNGTFTTPAGSSATTLSRSNVDR